MARMAVIMYRCDGCKTTGEPEPYPEHSRIPARFRKEQMPEDWVELKGAANKGDDVIHMQLCPNCVTEAIRLLLGMSLDSKPVEDQGVPYIQWARDIKSRPDESRPKPKLMTRDEFLSKDNLGLHLISGDSHEARSKGWLEKLDEPKEEPKDD